mmetsp:Transcript_25208/g.63088  ORF Transcript_25208/g.63088 Transcript_25208/m.63088 type:complete len:84 (+) Transcript_25208:40-291(+)
MVLSIACQQNTYLVTVPRQFRFHLHENFGGPFKGMAVHLLTQRTIRPLMPCYCLLSPKNIDVKSFSALENVVIRHLRNEMKAN